MSFIGATGLDENQEQFDILKDEIDANASYINNLVGIPDPFHTAIFGINVLNPGLFGLVERAEVKIKLLETAEEGLGTDLTGLTTQVEGIQTEVSGIQTEVSGIQTEITGIQGQVLGIEGDISTLNGAVFLEGGAIALVELQAADALTKANRALDIWDYSGDNVYHKKSGNVGIGTTFGSVLTNKLEVQGNINIPTGSTFRIGDEPFNYSHLAGEQPVSSKWTNATDVDTNIYYNSGNVGIGITTAIDNKLEVAGNLNISAGSKYKINNVNLAFSDLGGTLSYNSLTNQLTGGTNIQILNGVINNTYTYTLPTAGVGTGGALGGVKVDGTTININNGVISSTAGLPATIRLTPTPTDGFYSWINSQALLAKTPSTGVLYSSGSADGDIVLRSDTDKALILQSGIGDPAITLTAGLNRVRIHQRVGINTLPNTNYWLDVNGSINATEIRVGGNLIPISQWITSGANIYYSSGNVGIGTNANTTGVLLDVNGTIESRTGIGANSIFYFRGVANSDINRVISTGQFSTNSAVNDMVIRSTNKLVLQSGIADPAIVISTTNNVGIGTTAPFSILHLHKSGTGQDVRIILTDGGTTASSSRGLHLIKAGATAYLYNYENAPLYFGTNATTRITIGGGGQVGIQNSGYVIPNNHMSAGSLTIGNDNANYGGGTSQNTNMACLMLECLDNTEIAVHDSGHAFHSLIRYASNGNITMGRNMGWGVANVTMGGGLTVSSTILCSNGQVYARNGFDTLLYADGGMMAICMGSVGTGTNANYLRIGAYASNTWIESSSNRSIFFYIYSGVLSGTTRSWDFNINSGSYNALNSTTWTQNSDQRIKENIVKADLKTCYDNVKNINLYRFNYIDSFQTSKQDKNKLGYIAQEVKRHFPKATYRKKERLTDKREIPDLLSIDVEQINLTLYGAVKQLIKIVEKQNKRIKTLETLLNIDDNDDVENDAGEAYERIHDEEEIDIDTIEPTEPEQDRAPMGVSSPSDEQNEVVINEEEDIEEINVD